MNARTFIVGAALMTVVLVAACSNDAEDCWLNPGHCPESYLPPLGGAGGTGGVGGGGAGGSGGAVPCDGTCEGDTPVCDTATDTCVECLADAECTDVAAARCGDDHTCQPCTDTAQCAGIAGAGVCDDGTCVECSAVDASACGGTQTCDLLQNACVDVAPESLTTCNACSNDAQCGMDHRCVPMQFMDSPHGYYCLKEPSPTCEKPYSTFINQPSINGELTQNYCGIAESQATCEAVLALLGDWICTGTDGKCSPMMGEPEVDVPGALCRQVGALANRCTYGCAVVSECPVSGPPATCGMGASNPPGWCGG